MLFSKKVESDGEFHSVVFESVDATIVALERGNLKSGHIDFDYKNTKIRMHIALKETK